MASMGFSCWAVACIRRAATEACPLGAILDNASVERGMEDEAGARLALAVTLRERRRRMVTGQTFSAELCPHEFCVWPCVTATTTVISARSVPDETWGTSRGGDPVLLSLITTSVRGTACGPDRRAVKRAGVVSGASLGLFLWGKRRIGLLNR